jgi:hypothetical protein
MAKGHRQNNKGGKPCHKKKIEEEDSMIRQEECKQNNASKITGSRSRGVEIYRIVA